MDYKIKLNILTTRELVLNRKSSHILQSCRFS